MTALPFEAPVSYNHKHNEDNGQNNQDGNNRNLSWNCGIEGSTDNPNILRLRERQKRNFLTCLFLSAGVPVLLAGDELGRTQRGNNNPYCQDNEVSWVNWELDERTEAFRDFIKKLIDFRAENRLFRLPRSFREKDIGWFTAGGEEVTRPEWFKETRPTFGMYLKGEAVFGRATEGERIPGASFMLLFNRHTAVARFVLPGPPWAKTYRKKIDTALYNPFVDDMRGPDRTYQAGESIVVRSLSVVVLRATLGPDQYQSELGTRKI